MGDDRDEEIRRLRERLERIESARPPQVEAPAKSTPTAASGFSNGFFGCFGMVAGLAVLGVLVLIYAGWALQRDQVARDTHTGIYATAPPPVVEHHDPAARAFCRTAINIAASRHAAFVGARLATGGAIDGGNGQLLCMVLTPRVQSGSIAARVVCRRPRDSACVQLVNGTLGSGTVF